MITTVTLNAAIDKTYYVPRFVPGEVSRASRVYSQPGGKGINVARVIRQLDMPVVATGFVAGSNGDFIAGELDRQGVPHDFVRTEGESRLCLNIIDEASGSSTEILEPGPVISPEAMERMREKLTVLARASRLVCFSGSLPKGVPDSYYAELIALVQAEGAPAFLDTSGTALRQGVRSSPYFIKPNEDELAQLTGLPAALAEDELADRLSALQREGLRLITASLGAAGSLTLHDGRLYRAEAPRVAAVNTVGCGDAFVAGLAVGTARELPLAECLRLATAAGSANALSVRAGEIRAEDVRALLDRVQVREA